MTAADLLSTASSQPAHHQAVAKRLGVVRSRHINLDRYAHGPGRFLSLSESNERGRFAHDDRRLHRPSCGVHRRQRLLRWATV
jgi:hypothetical protein